MNITAILAIVLGFSMLLIGLSIWTGKALDIIAGPNNENREDSQGLARTVGVGMTLMAFLIIALGFTGEVLDNSAVALVGLLVVPAVGSVALAFFARGDRNIGN